MCSIIIIFIFEENKTNMESIQIEYKLIELVVRGTYYKEELQTNSPAVLEIESISLLDSEVDIYNLFKIDEIAHIENLVLKVIDE